MSGVLEREPTDWRPNLFVPGFPKCGTTALCDYLRQHPDIYMMEPKEPKTLAVGVEGPGWFVRPRMFARPSALYTPPDVYRRKFEQAKGFRYRAEGSQVYIWPPQFPGRLKRFAPDAKLIFMIREQKSRLRSMYAFGLAMHLEPNFERWVEKRFRPSLEFAFFERMLRSYRDLFGDSMRVVDNQDLLLAPDEVMREICAFLGVKDIRVTPLRSNVSEMKRMDERQRGQALARIRVRNAIMTPIGDLLNMMDQEGVMRSHLPLRRLNPFRGLGRKGAPDRGSKGGEAAASPRVHESIPQDLAAALDEDYAASLELCRSAGILLS